MSTSLKTSIGVELTFSKISSLISFFRVASGTLDTNVLLSLLYDTYGDMPLLHVLDLLLKLS